MNYYVDIARKLDRLLFLVGALLIGEGFIVAELDDLTAEVQKTIGLEESAIVLVQGLAAKLAAAIASGNPAALVALKDALEAKAVELSAALAANPL